MGGALSVVRAERVALAAVVDVAGRRVPALDALGGPVVLVFTATECPISNRYAPELVRLRDRFTPRGVHFRLVYADPGEPVAAVRRHLRAFGFGADGWRDPAHELVRLAGATVTPEVAVFAPDPAGGLRLVYR